MKMRYVRWTIGVVMLGVAIFSGWPVSAEVVDQVLATVDKEAILLSDIMMQVGPYIPEIQRATTSPEEFKQALDERVRATLAQTVDQKILLREALMANIEVDDDQLERRMEDLKKLYPSEADFRAELESSGQTMSELRSQMRKKLMADRFAYHKTDEFAKSIAVSESEVAQYYEDNKQKFERPVRVRCRRIFLSAPEDEKERAVVRARLAELRAELERGADFGELAMAYSQGPDASNEGIVGWITPGMFAPELEDPLFALRPGEISDIIETKYGFAILKADQREEAGIASLEDVRTEIEPEIRMQKAAGLYENWMADLRKRSRVRIFLQ